MEGKVHQSHTHTHARGRTHAHTHSWAQTITLWWLSASVWQTGRWEACWWRGLAQSFVILICSDHWHPSLLSYCARLYDVFIQTLMHRQLREKKFSSVKRYPNKIICFGLMIQCNPATPWPLMCFDDIMDYIIYANPLWKWELILLANEKCFFFLFKSQNISTIFQQSIQYSFGANLDQLCCWLNLISDITTTKDSSFAVTI